MDGLSPRAVFQHNIPAGGFRKPTEDEITVKTAERFPRVKIRQGGIIQLYDGKPYSDPRLLLIQDQVREVARARHNHEQISVLPAAKGEEVIVAKRRLRVGTNDPDRLSAHMEFQENVRKQAADIVAPRQYQPADLVEAEPLPAPAPRPDHPYTSSVEYAMEGRPKKRARHFADLTE